MMKNESESYLYYCQHINRRSLSLAKYYLKFNELEENETFDERFVIDQIIDTYSLPYLLPAVDQVMFEQYNKKTYCV